VSISRRHVVAGLSVATLAGLVPGKLAAQTQPTKTVDPAELLKPGPLGDHVLGKADAPVTIIEYASFTCGHCASFHQNTFPKLKEKYIDTGKVKLIFRVFPTAPAQLSIAAGMLAHCAGEDKYFAFTSALFETQRTWAGSNNAVDALLKLSNQAGMSKEKFEACLSDKKLAQDIQQVAVRGFETFGVNSTPTFFINGKTKLEGDTSFERFVEVIDPLLK
jgi:protein-disulfide isomerase